MLRGNAWGLLLLTALGCQRSADGPRADPPEQSAAQGAGSSQAGAPGACFIGPLFVNEVDAHDRPREYCVDDVRYVGASHRLGRRNVFGVTGDRKPGGYVRLRASEHRDLFAALTRSGTCDGTGGPMPQMRGDWPPEEGTYLTTVDKLRAASYLRAMSIESLDLVDLDPASPGYRRGEPDDPDAKVTATIRNPFDVPLAGLTLVFHYEGGRRKPMPRYRERDLPTTAPGAATTITMPDAFDEDGAWFHFSSLSVEGTAAGCAFVSSTYRR